MDTEELVIFGDDLGTSFRVGVRSNRLGRRFGFGLPATLSGDAILAAVRHPVHDESSREVVRTKCNGGDAMGWKV